MLMSWASSSAVQRLALVVVPAGVDGLVALKDEGS